MGEIVSKKDVKGILDDIGGSSGNPYLIYKNGDLEVKFTVTKPPEVTKPGEKDILGRLWNHKWSKVEMGIDVDTSNIDDKELKEELDEKKVLAMGGASNGTPTGALFKAFAINFDRNGLDLDEVIGTKWSLHKNIETGWYEIEYLGEGEVEKEEKEKPKKTKKKPKKKSKKKSKKPKKKKKSENDGDFEEIKSITQELKEEPEFEEAVAEDKYITAVALRGSVSMDDVEGYIEDLENEEVIDIDEDGDVIIN